MNADFVSFSLAKKLKEKGFREPCGYVYNYKRKELECQKVSTIWNNSEYWFAAPTISQVLKWLREKKKLHIELVAAAYGYNYIVSDTPEKGGTDRHCSIIKYEGPNDGGAWDEYEAAAIAGIEYVIDNLI